MARKGNCFLQTLVAFITLKNLAWKKAQSRDLFRQQQKVLLLNKNRVRQYLNFLNGEYVDYIIRIFAGVLSCIY